MFVRRYAVGLLAIAGLLGCFDTTTALDPDGPCVQPDITTDSWELVDRAGFDFRVPPGFTDLELQPIDSDAKVFEHAGGNAYLGYDFGMYTGDLTDIDCSVDIGGAVARLAIRELDDRTVVTARWRDLGPSSTTSQPGTALLMTGEAGEPDLVDLLLASIHSVVID